MPLLRGQHAAWHTIGKDKTIGNRWEKPRPLCQAATPARHRDS